MRKKWAYTIVGSLTAPILATAAPTTDLRDKLQPDLSEQLIVLCDAKLTAARDLASTKMPQPTRDQATTPIIATVETADLLAVLEKHFEYFKTGSQRSRDDNQVLACRITEPGAKCDTISNSEIAIDRANTHEVLFGEDPAAGNIRKALIGMLTHAQASRWMPTRPIAETTFVSNWKPAVCKPKSPEQDTCSASSVHSKTETTWSASQALGQDDDKAQKFDAQSAFLNRFVVHNDAIDFKCVGPQSDAYSDDIVSNATLTILDDQVVNLASLVDRTSSAIIGYEHIKRTPSLSVGAQTIPLTANRIQPTEFTRAFKLVKNPSQMALVDPKGIDIGTDINLDGSLSDLTIDAAAGFSFSAEDSSTKCKSPRLIGKSCRSSLAPGGSKRAYSIYGAYEQAPSTEKVFDESQLRFDLDPSGELPTIPLDPTTGQFPVIEQSFADGTISAGIRVDYEYMPWFSPPGLKPVGNSFIPGTRPLGSKSSFAVETITDPDFDLQANRFEATWTPPTAALYNLPSFRNPVGLLGNGKGPKFVWSVTTNIDGTSYARTPLTRDVEEAFTRRDIPDFVRVGADLELGLSSRLPASWAGRRSKIAAGYTLSHRESLSGKVADVFGDEISLSLEDLWQTDGKVSLTYINEDNDVTLAQRELVKLSIELKVD